jgi:hypothetical protein
MSNTAFDRAINFGVTAHPEVGRRLWWGYNDSAGNIPRTESALSPFQAEPPQAALLARACRESGLDRAIEVG